MNLIKSEVGGTAGGRKICITKRVFSYVIFGKGIFKRTAYI